MNDQGVDKELAETFRMAMRGYAGSVGIVTAAEGDERYAMTLTSAMSLSMDVAPKQ